MGSLVNSLIFGVLVMSILLQTQSIVRWKVVALAIASIFVKSSLHELMPGLVGAIAAVIATVVFVAVGLITWCELEWRPSVRIVAAYFGCSLVVSLFSLFLEGTGTLD